MPQILLLILLLKYSIKQKLLNFILSIQVIMNDYKNHTTTSKSNFEKNELKPSPIIAQQETLKTPEAINILYEARDNLREFADQIGIQKYTLIRHDVLQYCEKVKSAKCEALNYEKIEKMVKNRIQKMTKNKKIKKNWGKQDIFLLIWVISKYADFYSIQNIEKGLTKTDWNRISSLIPGTNAQSCMFKWLGLRNNRLSQYSWSQRQSLTLANLVNKYGQEDWALISQKLFYSNNSTSKVYRCPKQCRQHWCCFLNPNIKKGPWTPDEDWILFSQVRRKNGQRGWTDLSKIFNGRTENAIKNRYNFLIQKERQLIPQKNLTDLDLIDKYLQRNYISQFVNNKTSEPVPQPVKKSERSYRIKQQDEYHPDRRILRKYKTVKHKHVKKQSISQIKFDTESQMEYPKQIQSNIQQFSYTNQKISQIGSYIQNEKNFLPQILFQFNEEQNHEPTKSNLQNQNNQNNEKCSKMQKQGDSLSLEDIKVISLEEEEMQKIKQILFGITKGPISDFKFFPCSINQNRLHKLNM